MFIHLLKKEPSPPLKNTQITPEVKLLVRTFVSLRVRFHCLFEDVFYYNNTSNQSLNSISGIILLVWFFQIEVT